MYYQISIYRFQFVRTTLLLNSILLKLFNNIHLFILKESKQAKFHLLVTSQMVIVASSGPGRRQESKASSRSSTWVARTQTFGPSSAFRRPLAGIWIKNGTETHELAVTWHPGIAGKSAVPHYGITLASEHSLRHLIVPDTCMVLKSQATFSTSFTFPPWRFRTSRQERPTFQLHRSVCVWESCAELRLYGGKSFCSRISKKKDLH